MSGPFGDNHEKLAIVGLIFLFMPIFAFFSIVKLQHSYLQPATYQLSVRSTRTALMLPLYAFFMYIALVAPQSYVLMLVFIVLVEGFSFYSFFSLIVENMGGPSACVQLMKEHEKKYCCPCAFICCPSSPDRFYVRASWAMWHMFVTRTVIQLIAMIAFYSGTRVGFIIYTALTVLNAVILIYALLMLINFYENLYDYTKNLFGILKLVIVKTSVGLITLEGLVENFLYESGKSPYDDDDSYTAQEQTQRAYCMLVLFEFALLSILYLYAYGVKKITPPTAPNCKAVSQSDSAPNLSFGRFYSDILRVHSMYGSITLDGGLEKPLAETEKGENII